MNITKFAFNKAFLDGVLYAFIVICLLSLFGVFGFELEMKKTMMDNKFIPVHPLFFLTQIVFLNKFFQL